MGLMDKFKNLFTDEEIIEEEEIEPVEIKEVKKEEVNKLPTFMREKIEKEEKEQEEFTPDFELKKEIKLETQQEKETLKVPKDEDKSTFKFPIEFNENDFIETRSRQSIHNTKEKTTAMTANTLSIKEKVVKKEPKVSELYKDKKKDQVVEKKKFKATPIISPIYGVLDSNYTPEDMRTNEKENLEEQRPSKNVDFDSVRKKAYGNLNDEIKEKLMCENCEYLKEAKECQRERKKRDNLVYEILEGESEPTSQHDITLDEATENYYDYGVEYEKTKEQGLNDEVRIVNHEEEEHPVKEIPPVKSSINLLSTLKKSMGEEVKTEPAKEKDLELTDDLFNLIDSMYDERNDK